MKAYFYFFLISLMTKVHAQSLEGRVQVAVNPKIELMSVVFYLAGYVQPVPSDYVGRVELHFAPYRKHKTVQLLKKMVENRRKNDLVSLFHLGMYFSDFPDFRFQARLATADSFLLENYFRPQDFYTLFHSCEVFAEESKFWAFFQQNEKLYKQWAAPVLKEIIKENYTIPVLESFFKDKSRSVWHFHLCPLVNHFYAQTILPTSDKKAKEKHILIAYKYEKMDSAFNVKEPRFEDMHILKLLPHEACHFYSSSGIYATFRAQILQAKPKKIATYSWLNLVDENIVRATELYLAQISGFLTQTQISKRMLNDHLNGFHYVAHLIPILKKYDAKNAHYQDFMEFYPQLLEGILPLLEKDKNEKSRTKTSK